jgi:putative ABC transport system permease protein
MRGLRWLAAVWQNLSGRTAADRDLDAEVRAAVDLMADENRAAGMTPAEARRTAILAFGGIEPIKADVRRARAGAVLGSVLQDVRYATRLWRRNPLFAGTAALSLALGIGATTAIFTIANGLLLRPAEGVSDPARLVDIVRTEAGVARPGLAPLSYPEYTAIRDRSALLESVYGYRLQIDPISLQAGDGAERVFAGVVTSNYFHALGVPAVTGRLFDASDGEQPGTGAVAVLSHEFWLRRFQGDASVAGRAVRLNGRSFTLVGVARPGFRGMSVVAPDVWIPISMISIVGSTAGVLPNREFAPALMVGARLKPDVSRSQATAEVQSIGRALEQEMGLSRQGIFIPAPGVHDGRPEWRWTVERSSPIPHGLRVLVGAFLGILTGLVSLMLVLACTNLAGVLLARAAARRREIAIRSAIGAGRRRIVRQLLIETMLLFVAGGAAGVLLSRILISALVSLLPAYPLPVNVSVPFDGHVAFFALVVAFVAAVLCGIAPAWHAAKTDVLSALNDDAGRPDRLRLRRVFVAAQVALSLLLVVVAGLLGQTMSRVATVNRGFDSHNVVAASVDLTMADERRDAAARFVADLLPRIRQRPEVEVATAADRVPDGRSRRMELRAVGNSTQAVVMPNSNFVEPGYFGALKIPMIAGRDFTAADRSETEPVVIVGESTARRLWPGQNAVGKRMPLLSAGGGAAAVSIDRQVVGVVRDPSQTISGEEPPLNVYVPFQQAPTSAVTVLVRTSDPAETIAALRRAMPDVHPGLPVLTAQTLDSQLTGPVEAQVRVAAAVAGSVGLVGMLLAAIGIYGVTAYFVSQRTREIGIRLALGARRVEIVKLILRQGMTLVTIGSATGLMLGFAAGRVLSASELRVGAFDGVVFASTVVLFALIGLVACYGPARRATRLDPVVLLRAE